MRPDPPAASPGVTTAPFSKDPSTSGVAAPTSTPAPTPLTSRPKLNLQKRTVSQAETSPGLGTSTTDAKPSPFGAARPIDTSAREKEIEDKLKVKREAEDKAREEKRQAEEKAKDEKRLVKEAERGSATKDKTNGQSTEGENGDASKSYQILRRNPNETIEDLAENHDAEGEVVEEKSVKPQEVTRDIGAKRANGLDSDNSASPTTDQLEGDGWSTVQKPAKFRKSGNPAARAIAS